MKHPWAESGLDRWTFITPSLRMARWGTLLTLAWCLNGCHDVKHPENSASTVTQMKKNTKGRLLVSKINNAGRLVQIGSLDFDDSNRANLTTEGSGPDVEALKTNWAEISKMNELVWKQSRPGEVNGQKVMRVVGETAKPGDEMYMDAVLNTLERKYGYTVDRAKPGTP